MVTVYADDEAFYARWVEFGTVKAAAHPFFLWPIARSETTQSRIRRAQTIAAKKVAAS